MFTRRTTLAAIVATPLLGKASYAQDAIEVKEMVLGNPDAVVTVTEYASYTCTHCASFHADTYPQLKESYIDTNKITFLDWIVGENQNYDKKCICDTINMFNVKKCYAHEIVENNFVDRINLYKLLEKEFNKIRYAFSKKNKNCCIEGRDISTKILPNSDIKFFFKCNLNIAASRRYKK